MYWALVKAQLAVRSYMSNLLLLAEPQQNILVPVAVQLLD